MNIMNNLTELSKESPLIAGLISLWGLTVITFLFKAVPQNVINFIKRQMTSSLEIDNAQGWYHNQVYHACMEWFNKNKSCLKLSRTLSLYTGAIYDVEVDKEYPAPVLGPGYGMHIFKYKNRIMWMKLYKEESSGSEKQKRSLVLSCFGRDKSIFDSFLKDFSPRNTVHDIFFYYLEELKWQQKNKVIKRSMSSIAMDARLKDKIVSDIEHFKHKKDWFISSGLPYKLTYLLHGAPGTGKTSMIKAIASHFEKNICCLNINGVTDNALQSALASVPANSIVLIEDFDSSNSTRSRSASKPVKKLNKPEGEGGVEDLLEGMGMTFTSLTGVLNALDGVNSLHNVIIFMTTNHLESIDPAMYRKGRVDYIIEIGEAPSEAVREYVCKVFPDYDFSDVKFKDTLGCSLNAALLASKGDPVLFLETLGVAQSNLNELNTPKRSIKGVKD